MKYFILNLLILLLVSCAPQNSNSADSNLDSPSPSYKTVGEIQRLDSRLDAIIDKDAEIEILADGFDWTEGPLWIDDGKLGYVIFSDIPPNSIFKWSEEGGKELYLKPSGYTGRIERTGEPGSNGLFLDHDGNLLLCQHGDRRIAKMNAPLSDPKPDFEIICDNYDGFLLNSPNDAAMHSNGEIYFTDPPYGLSKGMEDESKQIPFQGVYRVNKEGKAFLLTEELSRPNGVALSKDESKLYVANSDVSNPVIMEYEITETGDVENGKVFFDCKHLMKDGVKGLPDGLKVNKEGVLFATGPGGVLILDPEGSHLGTISSGEATSNCTLDEKNGYIYATSDMYLIRVKLL